MMSFQAGFSALLALQREASGGYKTDLNTEDVEAAKVVTDVGHDREDTANNSLKKGLVDAIYDSVAELEVEDEKSSADEKNDVEKRTRGDPRKTRHRRN